MRNLVTGGAGFIGSHLIDKIMQKGEKVISIDNFCTGNKYNLRRWIDDPNFEIINHNIIEPIEIEVDKIWHLACPASPNFYQSNPIETAKTSFIGTLNMLNLAKAKDAKFLITSTSEIYGNPEIHPQVESYKGLVNPIGIRSCYDEGKRIAESLCFDFNRMYGTDVRVARIFNTYGPRMNPHDGRVISNFIVQALKGQKLTLYGEGIQTRSFCYVDDIVDGLDKLMNKDLIGPVNLGNPNEKKIIEIAKIIIEKINPDIGMINKKLPQDDPMRRKPCIKLAQEKLSWLPKVDIFEGIDRTISYFKSTLK